MSTQSLQYSVLAHLPDDGLADVGGNEQRDAAAEAVALVEQLIEQKDDESSNNKLKDVD